MPDWFLVLTLIVLGFILFLIETLIIPGFGLIGILALICLGLASYIAYTKLSLTLGVITALGSLIIIFLSLKLFSRTGIWRRLRLESREEKGKGFQVSSNREAFLNKEGVSLSALRPTGIASIEGKRVEVTTEGAFLPKDTPIRVTRVEGNKIIVRVKGG